MPSTGNIPGQLNNHPNNHPTPLLQNQPQIPPLYAHTVQPQIIHTQEPVLQQYQHFQAQTPITYIPAPITTQPTTSSQCAPNSSYEHPHYMTCSDDDSTLNDEKEGESNSTHPWQAVGKKRKRNPHSTPTEIHIPTTINNRYDPLTENTPDENTIGKNNSNPNTSTKPQPNPRPPPIYIYGVTNYRAMLNNLQEVIEAERFHTKTLSNNTVKVNTHSIEGYRQLIRHLNNENIVHHTYQLKQDRAYRIVLRDLHHSIPTEDIKEELQTYGHTARNIINIRHRVSKEPLPMFFVDLEPAANNKEIYKLEYLQNTKIRVEAPRIKNSIIQCTRCQDYGHSKTYCRKPYNCVKCGKSHDSQTCTKPKDTPATCALCNGNHPANYKGCTVYRDLKAKRYPQRPAERTTNKTNIYNLHLRSKSLVVHPITQPMLKSQQPTQRSTTQP